MSRKTTVRRNKRNRTRTVKRKETAGPERPAVQGGYDEFAIGPFGPEPGFYPTPRENAPSKAVDPFFL